MWSYIAQRHLSLRRHAVAQLGWKARARLLGTSRRGRASKAGRARIGATTHIFVVENGETTAETKGRKKERLKKERKKTSSALSSDKLLLSRPRFDASISRQIRPAEPSPSSFSPPGKLSAGDSARHTSAQRRNMCLHCCTTPLGLEGVDVEPATRPRIYVRDPDREGTAARSWDTRSLRETRGILLFLRRVFAFFFLFLFLLGKSGS